MTTIPDLGPWGTLSDIIEGGINEALGKAEEALSRSGTYGPRLDAIASAQPRRNLYNASAPDVAPESLLGGPDRGTVPFANYTVTGFIPVVAGQAYTYSNPRNVAFYDASKVWVGATGWLDNTGNPTVTITTPTGAAYVRASFANTYASTFQIEKGNVATPYVPYGYDVTLAPELLALVEAAATGGSTRIEVTGNTLRLTETVDGKTLAVTAALSDPTRNRAFNFGNVTHDGKIVSTAPDDIAPIRTQMGTVGANHGFAGVRSFTNPDGKTTADIGSVWTDGTREYVMLGLDAGRPVLGGSYTVDGSGVVNSATVAPTATLTHVSGATKTGSITHTTATATQLYPYVTRRRSSLWVSGTQVAGDVDTHAALAQVRESYEIVDYKSLYDQAKANPGTPLTSLNIKGAVLVENRYTFRTGGVCMVDVDLTELAPTTLGALGFAQAERLLHGGLGGGGWTTIRTLPGVAPMSGFDWGAGVDLDTYSANLIVYPANLLTPGQPPTVAIDRARTGGATRLGFALGYVPFSGVGAVTDLPKRATDSPNLWDLRGTDKNYPNAITTRAAGWGHVKARAFRVYLPPAAADAVHGAGTPMAAWAALSASAPVV